MGETLDPANHEFLDIQLTDGVAFAVLSRPEKLNSLRVEDHEELVRFLHEVALDDRVRSAVVTGAGRAFCAGGDFTMSEASASDSGARLRTLEAGRSLVYAHLELEKPIVAAINGVAAGAGTAFALLCDITIADRSARISDAHVPIGLSAGDGGVLTWPLSAGMAKAKRYLLTGDYIPAEEAERIGLITEVVDDGHCVEAAMEIATRLASSPQTAIRYTKRALNQQLREAAIRSFDLSLALEMLSKDTGENVEIVRRRKARGK